MTLNPCDTLFIDEYVNLLGDWSDEESSVLSNIWNIIVFGFCLAFVTGVLESVIELRCKSLCYQTEMAMRDERTLIQHWLLFLIDYLNRISHLWMCILAATIGWSLVTPNSNNDVGEQFGVAIAAMILFLFVGFIIHDYSARFGTNYFMFRMENERT